MKLESCNGCIYETAHREIDFSGRTTETVVTVFKCHRYPPTVLSIHNSPVTFYPNAGHRCGEFKELPKPQMFRAKEMDV